MAGLGWKQWTRERLSQTDLQGFIQDQVVQRFASAAARTTGQPAATSRMVSALDTFGSAAVLEMFTGAAWRRVAEPPVILRSNPAVDTSALTAGSVRGLHDSVVVGQPFGAGVPFFGLVVSRCLVTVQGASQARFGAVGNPDSFTADVKQNTSGTAQIEHLLAIDLFSTASADTYTYQPIIKAEAGTVNPINDQKFSFSIIAAFRGV